MHAEDTNNDQHKQHMTTLSKRQKIRVIFYGKPHNVTVFTTADAYAEVLDIKSANAVRGALERICEEPTCRAISYTTWNDIALQVDLL